MNNKITFFKKILSFLPFLNNFARKIYKNFTNAVYFVPFKKGEVSKKIISSKFYRFNLKNFEKFKKDNDFFLITKNKNIQHYSIEKFDWMTYITYDFSYKYFHLIFNRDEHQYNYFYNKILVV